MAKDKYEDLEFMTDVRAAVLGGPRISANILLLSIIGFFVGAGFWASVAELDEVTAGTGRVVPSSELQIIQNLEGGILEKLHVREGDVVGRGELLATIHNPKAITEQSVNESDLAHLRARILRLRAESTGEELSFSEGLEAEWPEAVGTQRLQYQNRKNELEASLRALSNQVRQRQQELVEAQSKINKLEGSLALAREEMAILRPLVEQGLKARIELIRLERQVNEIAGELATTQASVPRIRAGISEARGRIDERRAGRQAEISSELAEAQAELATLESQSTTTTERIERPEVRSPVEGKVQQILINTIGGTVQPGQDLIEVVPIEDNLLVEAEIRPSDIGFLFAGQKAIVKLTAYDFAIYGGLNATLEYISPDTITNEEGESFYKIDVRTNRNFLVAKDGAVLPIIPGMVAEVDILTGKKTVLKYLMKPILRAQGKALRER
jgi:membrane fusion protein, adhesin transport system